MDCCCTVEMQHKSNAGMWNRPSHHGRGDYVNIWLDRCLQGLGNEELSQRKALTVYNDFVRQDVALFILRAQMIGNLEAELRLCAIWRLYLSTLYFNKIVFRILDTGKCHRIWSCLSRRGERKSDIHTPLEINLSLFRRYQSANEMGLN